MTTCIQVNTRFLAHELTGVQRYTTEILDRLEGQYEPISPERWPSAGTLGHLWEQFVLPLRLDDRLFWNPTCPGPLAVSNQVITVHDLSALEHPEWFDWKYALWNRVLIPPLLHRVQHIVTVSDYTQTRIQDLFGVPRRKMTTIYNGVDGRFMPRPADEIAEMREALDLPAGPYVLSLSALQPRKNIQRLLRAWARIQEELQETTLVLAGGAARPTIFQSFSLDRIPPNVIFTDYVADEWLPALYSGATAFAYPSLYEGFGLPVLEAMACGTPVVTSNQTSLPEVAGGGAHLVDPHSIESIAGGVKQVLEDCDYRDELRREGRERAKSFEWERTATETLRVLEKVQSG